MLKSADAVGESDIGQFSASLERFVGDLGHSVRNAIYFIFSGDGILDQLGLVIVKENSVQTAENQILLINPYIGQTLASEEYFCAYRDDTFGDRDLWQTGASNEYFVSNIFQSIVHRYPRQIGAAGERTVADLKDILRKGDIKQICAVGKSQRLDRFKLAAKQYVG